MLIEAKKIIGLPVAAMDEEAKVGEITQIVANPEDGQILGFIIKTGGFFSPSLALSIVDIREWDPNGLVTTSVENLVDPKEIIRIQKVLDKNINFLEMSGRTESGKSLGKIEDLLIDTDNAVVAKYYLRDLLGNSRVLPADKVVKIEKDIIFTDDSEPIASGVQNVTA